MGKAVNLTVGSPVKHGQVPMLKNNAIVNYRSKLLL
jgi:hypothetical protein